MNPLNKADNNPAAIGRWGDDMNEQPTLSEKATARMIANMAMDKVLEQEREAFMRLLEETMAEHNSASEFAHGWRQGLARLKARLLSHTYPSQYSHESDNLAPQPDVQSSLSGTSDEQPENS